MLQFPVLWLLVVIQTHISGFILFSSLFNQLSELQFFSQSPLLYKPLGVHYFNLEISLVALQLSYLKLNFLHPKIYTHVVIY